MKTVLTVVGARPQFVKAAPLSSRIRKRWREILVHTGQHYDHGLSGAFFEELGLPVPEHDLGVGSAGHADQVSRMVSGLAKLLDREAPDVVLVYGDTNSTLAGALAAHRGGRPLAHVEAGLRSHRRAMPEEVNRIVTDHLADLCLAPTPRARDQLRTEGLGPRTVWTGDVMLDALLGLRDAAGDRGWQALDVVPGGYVFATVHRAENTDSPSRLGAILEGLGGAGRPVVLAAHPRTRAALDRRGAAIPPGVRVVEPLPYLTAVSLTAAAAAVATDSGGLQKEAFFLGVPCVTLREETEWTETVDAGWNVLAGADADAIGAALRIPRAPGGGPDLAPFGDGGAAERVARALEDLL